MSADCGLRGLDLLDAVIEEIAANPKIHYQADYRCGTGMCIAGLASDRAGGEWATGPRSMYRSWLRAIPGDTYAESSRYGLITHASDRARALMRLTHFEGHCLFAARNCLADIRRVRDQIAGRMARDSAAAPSPHSQGAAADLTSPREGTK